MRNGHAQEGNIKMAKVLFNATTCVVGGGAQVAASLISYASSDHRHEFVYAVSPEVAKHTKSIVAAKNYFVLESPPSGFVKGSKTRKTVRCLERDFNPDVAFTVFGPSYMRFACPHVCGYARPWDTHASPLALKLLSRKERARLQFLRAYRALKLPNSDWYWTETEQSRQGLAKFASVPLERIEVISNCFSPVFEGQDMHPIQHKADQYRVLSICAAYVQKRLPFIADVASNARQMDGETPLKFVVTLPDGGREVGKFWSRVHSLGVEDLFENIGPIDLDRCVEEYRRCSCVFLPTVLETFSVSFLEAMKMRRPVVASDLGFARDVCGCAAEFFQATSAEAASRAILKVVKDSRHRDLLIEKGVEQVRSFPTPREKYEMHMNYLEKVVRVTAT